MTRVVGSGQRWDDAGGGIGTEVGWRGWWDRDRGGLSACDGWDRDRGGLGRGEVESQHRVARRQAAAMACAWILHGILHGPSAGPSPFPIPLMSPAIPSF